MICFWSFLINTRSCRLAAIDLFFLQNPWEFYASFSLGQILVCVHTIWQYSVNHNSLCNTFLTHSCQLLYCFCASSHHSLIMWFVVSSLSPRNLHLLFSCPLSIFVFTFICSSLWHYFLLLPKRFTIFQVVSFCSHVYSCTIFRVYHLNYPYICFSFRFFFFRLYSFESFSYQYCLMVFWLSLRDSKFPQVSRIFFSILADLHYAEDWMVSYFQFLQSRYQSFCGCTESTYHNWYHRYFPVSLFFQFPSKVLILIFLFAFFQF